MRKVLFVADSLMVGGAERQLVHQACTLLALGAPAPCVVFLRESNGPLVDALGDAGVRLVQIDPGSRRSVVKRLYEVGRDERPDVIQSSHGYLNPYARLLAYGVRARCITAIRDNLLRYKATTGHIGIAALRVSDRVAANSMAACDQLYGAGIHPDRVRYLPNMLDSDLFPEVVRVRVPELRVFQIGRLVAEKRPLDLLDAISRLSIEQREGLKVTYVGDGPLGGELRNRIRDQRLGEVVRVMPATKDVMSVYSEADLLVLTSAWEGTPNVLLEGMATGCPVISYDVGDVGRIVRDGVDGYVVSSTPESLAFRLATILDQRNALGELGRSASRRVRNLNSASRLRESMVGLYSGL